MKSAYDSDLVAKADLNRPQGVVLRGQFTEVLRSHKGKLKGIVLRTAEQEYGIKLPKYLRPMLVRELAPGAFVQVWAYQEDEKWRGINVMPLSEAEVRAHQATLSTLPAPVVKAENDIPQQLLCVQVCTKGKCFKQGGRQILRALEGEVASHPDLQNVSIQGVGCMKACKKGPNIRLSGSQKVINGVTPNSALAVLSQNT